MAPQPPPLPNSYWVVPGRLLAGEHPSGPNGLATLERLQRLLDAGIDCFIDLTEPGELDAYDKLLPRAHAADAVVYLRRPIRDHGLPESTEQIEVILDALDSNLTDGRQIYLHCRAGIGRTNLVTGCWLARGGLTGEEALLRLNKLWRESERSQTWPSVPETLAQCEYVRNWRSQSPRAATPNSAAPVAGPTWAAATASGDQRDRCRGLLLGLAMGDAIGQSTHGLRPGPVATDGELGGGGPFSLPAGAWTDKTAMALCLAESLVERGALDARDQLQRYQQWQREGRWTSTGSCIGISPATARAIATALWTGNPFAGSHDPAHADAEPLARIGPAVVFGRGNPCEAVESAVNCARITHQAPVTLDAVRYFAALLAGALAGAGKEELLAPYFAPAPGFWDSVTLKKRVNDVALGSWRRSKPRAVQTGTNAATGALETALWAFEHGSSPAECLGIAASFGGNADITAAIVGQLAGAHYGAAALPPAWRTAVARGSEIQALADALYEAGMRPA
ncbi:MAG: 2 protein [Steroidobacteraceae bacterium]|nr:2 protein [Steroidobacteraceae bacterium]